jgi:hypothetical protein
MDEGAADPARASKVRVEKKIASAAFGRPAWIAGRKAPAATPDPVRGRSLVGEKCLMQRQPWWTAPGRRRHEFLRLWMKRLMRLQQLADSCC